LMQILELMMKVNKMPWGKIAFAWHN